MFRNSADEITMRELFGTLQKEFPDIRRITNVPVREYMIKWLSSFAPGMTYADAKAFCLPRFLKKNYLWHAFSFGKAEALAGEEADEKYGNGFDGECFILLNKENLLCALPDGKALTPEKLRGLNDAVIFKKDFSETYVYTGKDGFGPYYSAKC